MLSVHIHFNPLTISISSTIFVWYFAAPNFSLCDKSIASLLGVQAKYFFRLSFSMPFISGCTHVFKKFSCFSAFTNFTSHHGTIIESGITCKKICCYVHDSACRWLMVESTKIFQSYVKHFWIFQCEKNCRILIGSCK